MIIYVILRFRSPSMTVHSGYHFSFLLKPQSCDTSCPPGVLQAYSLSLSVSLTSSYLSVTLFLGGNKKTPVYLKNNNSTKKLHMLKVGHKGKLGNCSLKAQSFSYFRCDGTPKVIRAGTTFKLSLENNDYLLLEVKEKLTYCFITKIYKSSSGLSYPTNHRILK